MERCSADSRLDSPGTYDDEPHLVEMHGVEAILGSKRAEVHNACGKRFRAVERRLSREGSCDHCGLTRQQSKLSVTAMLIISVVMDVAAMTGITEAPVPEADHPGGEEHGPLDLHDAPLSPPLLVGALRTV